MKFGIWEIFQVAGSLAFFIYGMKMMSDGIQRAAGAQMRTILRTMTKNRFLGVFTGFLITALVQSSSATTVMTVSFVNAGLMSLVESAGVMMGANIGTTITGWIVSLLGFKIKLGAYSIPLFAIAIPMLFSNRGKVKYWGEFLLGFAILFFGLTLLQGSVPDLRDNPEALSWVSSIANWGFFSRVLFVLVGAVMTIVIQSSSAAMTVTLIMLSQGWLSLDIAAAMILGENIGTTITAEIASMVGNVSSKRSARIHSLFNVIGVIWMVILLPFILPLVESFMGMFSEPLNPTEYPDLNPTELLAKETQGMAALTLAAFHTFFNLANVILLIGFVPFLVKAAIWSVKPNEEDEEDDEFRLKFINTAFRTPELSTVELQKETSHFGEIVSRMSGMTKDLLNSTESKKQKKLLKQIKKYEKITDTMEEEITAYITKLANAEVTPKTSIRFRSIASICNDLERIGDIYFQISKAVEAKIEEKAFFVPEQRANLNKLSEKIDGAFAEMVKNLESPSYDDVSKAKAVQLEKEINHLRDKLRKEHLSNLGNPEYHIKSSMIYNNIFHSLEKIGDHIMNVTESIVGEI